MKFCVIKNLETEKYLGKEYEAPYRYSSWTSGGDYWWNKWGDLELANNNHDPDNEYFRLAIFENKEEADKYIKDTKYLFEEIRFSIVNLGDL